MNVIQRNLQIPQQNLSSAMFIFYRVSNFGSANGLPPDDTQAFTWTIVDSSSNIPDKWSFINPHPSSPNKVPVSELVSLLSRSHPPHPV